MRESGTARLQEAVAADREALNELTRERAPLQWAEIQKNMGDALGALGLRESGTATLEKSLAAYREALKEFTKARTPLEWARTVGKEGVVLMHIAERKRNVAQAETALERIKLALEAARDGSDNAELSRYQRDLDSAQAAVARLRRR